MGFREIGWKGVDWMLLAQDRDQWRALVKTIMKFLVSLKARNFLTGSASQGLCSKELVS
jgi:hypothetical protein